LAPSSSFSI